MKRQDDLAIAAGFTLVVMMWFLLWNLPIGWGY